MGRRAFAIGRWRAGIARQARFQLSAMKVHSDISQTFLFVFFTAQWNVLMKQSLYKMVAVVQEQALKFGYGMLNRS